MKSLILTAASILCIVLTSAGCAVADPASTAATPPASRPVQSFPLGVYWGWEQNTEGARQAGLEKWAFVKKTCELLPKNGIDTVWLVNIELADLKKLLKITRPLGLKVLPGLAEIEPRNLVRFGFTQADPQYQEKALAFYKGYVPEVVREVGEDRDGILAWVIIDEPDEKMLPLVEPVRQLFAEADLDRPATLVSTWNATPSVIANTRLSTFCIDVYPFFGPLAPSGPHTPEASQNYYSSNVLKTVAAAGQDGRTSWVMGQSYAEVHGPWKRDKDGNVVAAPGSFINWRMPTPAEMRWQMWEGLRAGVKGIIFFPLFIGYQGDLPVAAAPTDPIFERALVKEPTPVGQLALLDNKGGLTPQFKTMSSTFRALVPHKALLRRLMPSSSQWLSAGKSAQIGNFVDPETKSEYAVVVNPDLVAAQTVSVIVSPKPGVLKPVVMDVLRKTPVKLEGMGWAGGNFRITISLQAGEGVLLKLNP